MAKCDKCGREHVPPPVLCVTAINHTALPLGSEVEARVVGYTDGCEVTEVRIHIFLQNEVDNVN